MRASKCCWFALFGLLLGGCAGLQDIVQGSIDQAAKADSATRGAESFQVPEDALAYRDHQLTETLQLLGRQIARGYRPKSQVILVAANRADADWLVAGLRAGIHKTGWSPEAVMWPVQLQVSNAYPRITVMEAAPGTPQPKLAARAVAAPTQPRPLTEPLQGARYSPPPADFRVTMIDPVSPESRDHLATLQQQLKQYRR